MEDTEITENCVPLAIDFKPATNNFSSFQSPLMQEALANASVESKTTEKSNESSQNVRKHFLKATEVFENDCPLGKSTSLRRRSSLVKLFDPLHLMPESLPDASFESKIAQKSNENSQNARKYFLKGSEVFKNDCSSGTSTSLRRRSSLMNLFDPLHSMKQSVKIYDVLNDVFSEDREKGFLAASCHEVFSKEIMIKYASNIQANETLILLESPRKLARPLIPKNLFSGSTEPVKKYSEEEYCRALQVQEFRFLKEFSQKYSEYEKTVAEKDRMLNSEFSAVVALNRTYSEVLSEALAILERMKTNNEETEAKLLDQYMTREKLKLDIEISKEDLCTMENAFSDIYKRYETSKTMIKSYKENEEHLRHNIESMQVALDKQTSMNDMLESRTEKLIGKATTEIESAKKTTDTQIMISEAQLKKTEMKIVSLENDLKQAKSTNANLGSIYDDLMAKFTA